MARKTHVIAYRLGETTWWGERTAPSKEERGDIIRKIVKGVMEKFGIWVGEMRIEGGENWEMKVVGVKEEKTKEEKIKGERSNKEVYVIGWIEELVKEYAKRGIKISYREEERIERSAKIMEKMIEKGRVMDTMRKIKVRFEKEKREWWK